MNGPEHYREAESRLGASDWQRQQGDLEDAMHEAAMAQVHATLAVAAATAANLIGEYVELEADAEEWLRATVSTKPRTPVSTKDGD